MSYSVLGTGISLLVAATLALGSGCADGSMATVGLTIQLHATPPPDDESLSPLRDPSVIAFELRDSRTEELLGRSLVESAALTAVGAEPGTNNHTLDLGLIAPWGKRDLKFYALGTSGQVLGQALARDVVWNPGESATAVLELRRPLFLLGGGTKLVAPIAPPSPNLTPGRELMNALRDESLLRIFDQNLVSPLLSQYNRQLDSPVLTVAGTHDGLAMMTITSSGRLYFIDTLKMDMDFQIQLPNSSLYPQLLEISEDDSTAIVSFYNPSNPSSDSIILFMTDLRLLRKAKNLTGHEASHSFKANTIPGPPISITYAPDGLVDVLFSVPPIRDGQPDCSTLSGPSKTLLNRYDPLTGTLVRSDMLPYSSSIAYNLDKERILVQPCLLVSGSVREGAVVIERTSGPLILPAPGVTNVLLSGRTLSVIGRDNSSTAPNLEARGAVRQLLPGSSSWTSSLYSIPSLSVPYRVTITSNGDPYSSSVDIRVAPSDLLVYKAIPAPDKVRAFALTRTTHSTRGLYITSLGSMNEYRCYLDYSSYIYGYTLINLQSGVPEVIIPVGLKTIDCSSRMYDSANSLIGTCFPPCSPADPMPYLKNYQSGYIPSAVDATFGH